MIRRTATAFRDAVPVRALVPLHRTIPILIAAATLAVAVGSCWTFGGPVVEDSWPPPLTGMVVCEHPLAARAGVDVLEDGGNAADAAVATALALAVVYPQAGNLGGGGFAVWVPHDPRDDKDEPLVLDFRETAPAALSTELFLDPQGNFAKRRSLDTGLGVGVPGSPSGLWELNREKGSMNMWQLAREAIRLADEGFPVDEHLARTLQKDSMRSRLTRDPVTAARFYPGGRALAEGDRLMQPELAKTLAAFAREGPTAITEGKLARALVARVTENGGVMTEEDLADYEVIERKPLVGWFRGLQIITVPPPSSGGVVLLQFLNIVDGLPLDEERTRTLEGTELRAAGAELDAEQRAGLSGRAVHWWIEALRRSFADRQAHLEDPDFGSVPVAELLSPEWIAQRRVSMGELATPRVEAMPEPQPVEGETTHISVLDRKGNAVSLTTTLNTSFGTGIMVPEGGFLLNNEIDDFSIVTGSANAYGLVGSGRNDVEPGKRPLSSMTPVIVREGGQSVRLVIGSPGGPRIITAVAQVILRTEVYEQSLPDAVAGPRLHQQWDPHSTLIEVDVDPAWDPVLLQDLRNRGHELDETSNALGSVQAIQVEVGGIPVGASDPRRGGVALAEEE